jgi:hypothetical protein
MAHQGIEQHAKAMNKAEGNEHFSKNEKWEQGRKHDFPPDIEPL